MDTIENITLYGFYPIDAHWFLMGNHAYGLSATTSEHSVAMHVCYYF